MARQEVTGPSTLTLPMNTNVVEGQYFAAKTPATWSVAVTDGGSLSPSDYTVTISANGLVTVTIDPDVIIPPGGTTMSLTVSASSGPGSGNNDSLNVTVNLPEGIVPCFVKGTKILTSNGLEPVEALKIGDRVQTMDNGLQDILWIGRCKLTEIALSIRPKLRPVTITAGALGAGFPNCDLHLSRQHRVLVNSPIARRMFQCPEVLVPAIKLISLPGVFIDETVQSVEYLHLLFDRHEILFSEGLPTESLLLGNETLKEMDKDTIEEIRSCFPEISFPTFAGKPVRLIPNTKQQKKLVKRHGKNRKPFYAC